MALATLQRMLLNYNGLSSRRPILPLLLIKAHHTNLRRIPLTGNIDISRLGGLPPTISLLV
jgi:hypothetical protein